VFDGAGAELVVDSNGQHGGTVTNFTENETIDLRGVDPASVAYPGDGKLHYGDDDTSFPLSLGVAGTVQAATDNNAGADVTALCFCAGTRLATPDGEVPVEHLAVGDLVLTAHGAARRSYGLASAACWRRGTAQCGNPGHRPQDALAPNVPHHDLRVTKGHAFWLDGVLIPVESWSITARSCGMTARRKSRCTTSSWTATMCCWRTARRPKAIATTAIAGCSPMPIVVGAGRLCCPAPRC